MTTIEKAGAPQQPASQIIDELSPIVPHEMSGRELLRTLAAHVIDLCRMVSDWQDDIKRLQERVEQLEQRGRN